MPISYAVVIVNWNAGELLRACLASLEAALQRPAWVGVVDNGSIDGSDAMVEREFPAVRLLRPRRNLGFAAGCNLGIREILSMDTCPEAVLLLNPDAEVRGDAPTLLLSALEDDPSLGVVGGQLVYPDGTFQGCAAPFPTLWRELLILSGLGRRLRGPWYPAYGPAALREPRAVGYVVGAALLARTAAIRQVGLLDENFFIYSEEVDWCYRFWRAGWRVVCEPRAGIKHHVGASTRQVAPEMLAQLYRSRVIFFHKHYGRSSATALKGLIWTATAIKLLRRMIRPASAGTPPLPMPLLRAAFKDI